jgi:SAM-dependent methyltransferase
MTEWKITPQFGAKGVASLREKEITALMERGDGMRPGYLTIDVYPERMPRYPARHFGTWQFSFDEIGDAEQVSIRLDTEGVGVSCGDKALSPVKVIQGHLKEDGLYIAYVVLAEKDTYAKLHQTQYYRHLSFSGAPVDPTVHWPESRRRNLRTVQSEYWMMKTLYEAVEKFASELPAEASVLDYGGGCPPYHPCFAARGIRYTNADVYDGQFVDLVYKADERLPLADNSCDAILCTHVLEHVKDPLGNFADLYRVLKNDGKILVAVPFAWEHHFQPVDFWRFGLNMVESMFSPFKEVKIATDGNAAQAMILFRNCYYDHVVKSPFLRNLLMRWGNFKYRLHAAEHGDKSITANFIITATK